MWEGGEDGRTELRKMCLSVCVITASMGRVKG